MRCPGSRGFRHSSPSRHQALVVWTLLVRTVDNVVASPALTPSSDPVTVVSGLFAVPLRELYAVLWRLGVIDIGD
ncbi:Rv1535 domain-containing protein [Mycobacterium sp. SMC-4]|uniref:Rv1535 domain-containing protein n=1 Tax=Mycobacterium sp. SMC-4 TaxID=2857059 RepID=UPI003D0272C7